MERTGARVQLLLGARPRGEQGEAVQRHGQQNGQRTHEPEQVVAAQLAAPDCGDESRNVYGDGLRP
jgi:hypothetical protein